MDKTHDLIVVGAGSGGLATAFRAAAHGARVALLEPHALGGTCVNVGCVPKKAMWYAAEMAQAQQLATDYGFALAPGKLDWPAFIARRDAYIGRVHASYRKRIASAGIELIAKHGRLTTDHGVQTGERRLSAPHIVLATGARSRRLNVPGFGLGIDSDGFFDLRECPQRVAVVGGGYIGIELAGVLHALGAEVDLFARHGLLTAFDREMGEALREWLEASGIRVHCNSTVDRVDETNDGLRLTVNGHRCDDGQDTVLWAVGRVPNTDDLGLEEAGVACDKAGYITVDAYQDTSIEGVHAVGDVTRNPALTPVAIAAGRQLAERLFAGKTDARLAFDNIPSVVFSHPPFASVGLGEEAARERYGDGIRVYHSRFTPMQLSLSDHPHQALMKLICAGDDDRVVGVHSLGPGSDEMIQGFAVALKAGATKADFDATVAVHPTASEELVLMG